MRAALAGDAGMDVACGDCRGCCTSSYFVKVRAHEKEVLERIGADNLRPVPGANNGNMLMGFDEQGHCFMFARGNCSIYSHRPETCRTYDCRVFTAAGMNAGEGKTEINERISRWQFDYPQQQDRDEHLAVTAAANFIRQHPIRFRSGRIPSRPSEIAVLAVKCYEVFLNSDRPDAEIAEAIVEACRNFDSSSPG
jgi:Fe-S-cluster containining protein